MRNNSGKHAFIYYNESTFLWHWTVNNGLLSVQGDTLAWSDALDACDAAMRNALSEQYESEKELSI